MPNPMYWAYMIYRDIGSPFDRSIEEIDAPAGNATPNSSSGQKRTQKQWILQYCAKKAV